MTRSVVSESDRTKLRRFYEELNPSGNVSVVVRRGKLNAKEFVVEVAAVLDAHYWEADSFDQYIERETHFRMVEETGRRDPATLQLTPDQYQEQRNSTLRAFTRSCITLMKSKERYFHWDTKDPMFWMRVICSLKGVEVN